MKEGIKIRKKISMISFVILLILVSQFIIGCTSKRDGIFVGPNQARVVVEKNAITSFELNIQVFSIDSMVSKKVDINGEWKIDKEGKIKLEYEELIIEGYFEGNDVIRGTWEVQDKRGSWEVIKQD